MDQKDLRHQLDDALYALLDKACREPLQPAESQALSQRLRGNPELQKAVLAYFNLHASLQRKWRGGEILSSSDASNVTSSWRPASLDREAVEAHRPAPTTPPSPVPKNPIQLMASLATLPKQWLEYRTRRWSLGIAGLAATLLIVVLLSWPPHSPPLATYENGVNVAWGDAHPQMPIGQLLNAGLYTLEQGVAELVFRSGARMILEGPCAVELLEPDKAELQYGKVFVSVGPETQQFIVETPTGTIVDHGTAFGVHALKDGSVQTLVEEGRVTIAGRSEPESKPRLVEAGHRGSIDQVGYVSDRIVPVAQYEYWKFRRAVSIELELPDLITKTINADPKGCGINPATGAVHSWSASIEDLTQSEWFRSGDAGYQQVSSLPFVDGVFVPHDGSGVQISSDGHKFSGFPSTSDPQTWNDIWFGPQQPLPEQDPASGPARDQLMYRKVLSRITSSNQAIFMPSPKGITFDLYALRKEYPGLRASRFRTAVIKVDNTLASNRDEMVADFWALVDGEVMAVHRDLNVRDGVINVEFDIPDNARFLTLMSTVGSDQIELHDRIVLIRASIDMAPHVDNYIH